METLFLKILNMSITAGYIILGVMAVRLLLKKAPKKYAYLLWSIVGFRLVCPVTFASVFSVFNLRMFRMNTNEAAVGSTIQYITEKIAADPAVNPSVELSTGIVAANTALKEYELDTLYASSVSTRDFWIEASVVIWCVGILALLIYSLVSYIRLKHRMEKAVILEGGVYQSDQVRSPFILGFL